MGDGNARPEWLSQVQPLQSEELRIAVAQADPDGKREVVDDPAVMSATFGELVRRLEE